MENVHANSEEKLIQDPNLLINNIQEEEEEELDFDLDYDPNQMYYELLAS